MDTQKNRLNETVLCCGYSKEASKHMLKLWVRKKLTNFTLKIFVYLNLCNIVIFFSFISQNICFVCSKVLLSTHNICFG